MSNMDDFFKSEIPTMILNAIAETAKNYSAKEPNINIKAKPNYTYSSLINAGFSVTQAFELIGYTLIG